MIAHDRSIFRLLRVVLGIVMVGGSVLALRAREEWLSARTAHFEMFSSASEAESRRVLLALEQFRANFLASFPLKGASEPRATIVLFDSASQFRPYRPLYHGKPKDVLGFFLPGEDEVMIAMTSDVPEGSDAAEVIYHEYIHLLLHAHDTPVPLWLNEGLAELFSTFRVKGDKVEFGAAKDSHVIALNEWDFLPLSRLFNVTHNSPDYNEERRVGIFYAESWAFTHYLMCGEDRTNTPKLARFVELLGSSTDPEIAFREAFKTDYKTMERALQEYLHGGRYFTRVVPALLPGLQVNFQPADPVDRDFALLNLRWRVHESGDAAFRALELLGQRPDAPRPHELLAAIANREGNFQLALDHWRRAAELKSTNPFVYVQLVRDALSAFKGISFLDTRLSESRTAQLRDWIGRALELDSENADAVELAALNETLAEEISIPIVNQVQKVAPKMREPSRTLLALAIIRWRTGDPKTAANIVDLVLSLRRADMPTRAAAGALRVRLSPDSVGDDAVAARVEISPEVLASRAAIALQNGRSQTAAGSALDRILAERGTTAPRAKLAPLVVTSNNNTTDAWQLTEHHRQRAADGDAAAMLSMAIAHACGSGAEFSPTLAVEWLQKAAQSGNAAAKVWLQATHEEPDAVCQFLRKQDEAPAAETYPPLDAELKPRIDEKVKTASPSDFVIVHRATPHYPDEKNRAGSAGETLVQFTIDATGHPQAIKVVQATDSAFATAAEECIREWRFLPAVRDRAAIRTQVEQPIRFEIAK
jgi:TonB family protein